MLLSHLDEKHFEQLKSGIKTVELRLNDTKRRQIKVGDQIKFLSRANENEYLLCQVVALHKAPDFKTLCETSVTPRQGGFESLDELIKVLEEFYTPAAQQKFGVLGIEIKLI